MINLLVFCSILALAHADFCQDNFTLSELPKGLLSEVISLVTTGKLNYIFGCPEQITINDGDVNLWLFTRENRDTPILLDLNKTDQIDPSKPIKILIPGWLCNVTNDRIPELTDAYLNRYDCNIIGVDWSRLSIDHYSLSYCKVPLIGQTIGAYLCKLSSDLGIDLGETHVLGHSLGGQISGFIGQETKKQCAKSLGRITGLDPAGPLYQYVANSRRLDESDALLVDVIHTNQAFLGYFGKCGTVDFYPSCGTFQSGCLAIDNTTNISDIISLPTRYVACNHLRAADYMTESISSNNFIAKSCTLCPGLPVVGPCIPNLFWQSRIPMGEDCPRNPPHPKYILETNSEPPFAKG